MTAIAAGFLWGSPLAFVTILALFLCTALVWRRGGEPALAWCLAYQWLAIFAGYSYFLMTGEFPASYAPEYLDLAVWLSIVGLAVITVGIRAGTALTRGGGDRKADETPTVYSIPALFWLVMGVSVADSFMKLTPMAMFFEAAQIIYRLLEFRWIFFFLLLVSALRRRTGYRYCMIAGVVILLPSLSSPMSAFQGVFIMSLLAILSEWRPWAPSAGDNRVVRRLLPAIAATGVVLVLLAILWNGAVKQPWRARVLAGQVSASTLTAANQFLDTAVTAIPNMKWGFAWRGLQARLSSGLGYFSFVLNRVPDLVPYENGGLTMRTIRHVTTPRILFPEKAIVDSASWMIRLYAGLSAAGSESGTSIGLTYMAEFYIDFGIPGMFIGLFVLGATVGLMYGGLRRMSPSYDFFRAAAVALFPLHFAGYESELLKAFGGMFQAFLVYSVLLLAIGPWLNRVLTEGQAPHRRKRPAAGLPVRTPPVAPAAKVARR